MEWLTKMNDAIDYIESHIAEKIDVEDAARVACCSLSRFQRMFSFATDISVTEYIRCRRMSIAANELLKSDIKVIDIALKCGYESPEAFTRAFQAFHGIPPTSVRKLGIFTNYPRISFQITINGGNFGMGTRPLVRIEEFSNAKVVSFEVNCLAPEDAAINLLKSWALQNISDYTARRYIGCAPKGHHAEGEEHQSNEDIGSHEYVMQMFLFEHEGCDRTFLGANVCEAPKGLYLVGDVAMNEFSNDGSIDVGTSMQTAYGIMAACLKEMGGYAFELKERPYYEEHIWHKEWFDGKLADDQNLAGFKLWLPIKKI